MLLNNKKPAICVPLTNDSLNKLEQEAINAAKSGADILEWRVDLFSPNSLDLIETALKSIKSVVKDIPLIFTFRSKNEGGRDILPQDYKGLLKWAIQSGYIDFVDIEAFFDKTIAEDLIVLAKENSVYTILSNHDFNSTPPLHDILECFEYMHKLGGDVFKIAVMPQTPKDVLTLLEATHIYKTQFPTIPLITVSMGKLGALSRVSGEVFGSSLTFATVDSQSAPGQLSVKAVREMLNAFSLD